MVSLKCVTYVTTHSAAKVIYWTTMFVDQTWSKTKQNKARTKTKNENKENKKIQKTKQNKNKKRKQRKQKPK